MNVNPDGRWNPTNKTKQTQTATQKRDQKEPGLTNPTNNMCTINSFTFFNFLI